MQVRAGKLVDMPSERLMEFPNCYMGVVVIVELLKQCPAGISFRVLLPDKLREALYKRRTASGRNDALLEKERRGQYHELREPGRGSQDRSKDVELAACPLDQSRKRDAIVIYVTRQYSHPGSIIDTH